MTGRASPFRARLLALLRDSSGGSAAEFALILPFFVVLVFGTINTGMAMWAVSQLHYAAERSARCLAVNVTVPCSKANIDTYGKSWYQGPGVTALSFASPATDPACGKQVTGTASYAILTGINSTAITIYAKACYPII